ncbi:dihydropteroate synthase [Halobacteriales archaeon QS_1_68_20]|nr:MAG: dihydropteroate synthase [Halobacteriales archaeon QS_1_68_20]
MRTVDAGGLPIGDGHPPRIMGVLNVSEESPYDPSVFADPAEAARYVDRELIDEGADVVDVGLESANKRYEVLPPEEELARLDTAVETIERVAGDAVFSIETRYAEVADEALSRGFDMVNDVCGFADPEMPEVCRDHDAAVVKMASPPDLERPGAVEETPWAERKDEGWAESADYVGEVYEALKQNGVTDKTIVDPAFGSWSEAQGVEEDRETFRRLREFRGLGRPILVSINRKNFLRMLADRSTEEALPVSLAATSMAVERGAHLIRTHDVAETRDAALVGDAFTRDRHRHDDEVRVEELDVTTPGEADRHLERVGADRSLPPETTTRVYDVSGLSEAQRGRLADAAGDVGATLAAGTSGALLFGTEGALDRLAAKLADASGGLAAVREVVGRRDG